MVPSQKTATCTFYNSQICVHPSFIITKQHLLWNHKAKFHEGFCTRGWKVFSNGCDHLTTEKSPEPRKLLGWTFIYSIRDTKSSKLIQLMILGQLLIIPPAYKVYRGYIVFAFSLTVFVCLCVNFLFYSKISQEIWYKHWIWFVVLCKKQSASSCLLFLLFVHFSFSPIKCFITELSASMKASLQT